MKDIKKDTTTQKENLTNNMPTSLKIRILSVISKAEIPEIKSITHYQNATDTVKYLKVWREKVEEERRKKTDPLLARQKAIKASYDELARPLDALIETVRHSMGAFIVEEQKRKDAEQLMIEAKAKADNPDKDTLIVPIVNDIRSQKGEVGKSNARKVWKFRYTDIDAVPREYCTPNDMLIREAIAEGKREIPGVEIYEATQITIR